MLFITCLVFVCYGGFALAENLNQHVTLPLFDYYNDNCDKYLNTMHNTSDAVIKFDNNICINKTNIQSITFICRQDTYLCMEWNMVIDGNPVLSADDIKYLIESKTSNNSDSLNTSVLWTEHGWSPGRKFCVTGLRRNTEYVFRLTPYFREVQIGQPELSSFITTYYGNENLEAISRIRVEDFSSNIGSLDGILKWEPTKDNVCQTDILMYKDGELGLLSEKIVGESSYNMKELSYSSLYVVLLFTSVAKSESNKTQFSFMTPSCLQLNDNDLNKCVPDPPSNLSIADECTTFIISWDEPEVCPDFYSIIFQYDEEVNNFTVPGNVTVFTFEDHNDAFFYFIYMKAVGPFGESRSSFISEKFKCFNRKDMLQHPSSTDSGSGHSFNPTAILITAALTIAIAVCFVIWFIYFCVRVLHNDIDSMLPEDSFRKDNLSKFKNVDETDEIMKEKTEIEGKVGIRDEYEVNRHQIQLCEILGHGEFGVVHRGVFIYDNKCTENVAVKTLRNRGNAEEKRQLEKEMEVMKSVGKHRNIVSLLGCCTHDMMIIVEYCSLGDLRKFLRKAWRLKSYTENDKSGCKFLSERRAFSNILYDHSGSETRYFNLFMMDLLSFARQIALGMAYLSKNRVVHRDLAARNVLLAEDMTAKIADFGLSRDVYERNIYMKRSTDRLPLRWMAIESLIYQVFSTKSDVWSYGILLWEIMTLGGCPYPSLQTSEVFRLLQQGYRMDRPKPCSQKIYDIMLRCWDSKPQNRPTFTQIVTEVEDLMKCATNRSYLELSAFQYKRHLDKGRDIN